MTARRSLVVRPTSGALAVACPPAPPVTPDAARDERPVPNGANRSERGACAPSLGRLLALASRAAPARLNMASGCETRVA